MAKAPAPASDSKVNGESGRTRISQQDVPSMSLAKALRVATAIGDQYGYKPVTPVQLAKALEMQTTSGPFRMITGASIAYGLTKGGYNADAIALEPLGLRIVRPTEEDDDLVAKREATLKPRVVREFLQKYDGAAIPREDIALHVINDMGVPPERAKGVLEIILESAETVGFLQDIKGRKYVELGGAASAATPNLGGSTDEEDEVPTSGVPPVAARPAVPPVASLPSAPAADDKRARRVFVTHGKNVAFVEPIRKLLAFGELEPVVSVDKQSVSQPVPDKVMGDMRSCGAAIIHVDEERRLNDEAGNEHVVLNPNVLIEIGAAMALYGRRFILLVKEGVKLPSNLQGLYEVRYSGDQLDSAATIKLLEAIRDIKNHPAPGGA
jgi:predicted nucleotide-binding protein